MRGQPHTWPEWSVANIRQYLINQIWSAVGGIAIRHSRAGVVQGGKGTGVGGKISAICEMLFEECYQSVRKSHAL